MSKLPFFPIILGSDDNAYGTARLFHEKYGDAPRPLFLCTRPLRATAYTRIADCRVIPDFDTDEVFLRELDRVLDECLEKAEKCLVIPCSDYYLYLLSRHYEAFGGKIANRVIPEELLTRLDTKDSFYALCREHGLPYPGTVVAAKEERLTALDGDPLTFPIIVKPENSNATAYLNCAFEGKKKVFFFQTKEEYLMMVTEMNRSDYRGKLILQEYVRGDDSAMRTLNCYVGNDGKVKTAVLGQVVLEEYAPKTLGNYAAILRAENDELVSTVSAFLENIGYRGFANFDIKRDAVSGKYYLFEINPRLGRSSFFVHSAGINMMELLVNDCIEGNTGELRPSGDDYLWTAVPKAVLRKYIRDDEVRGRALSLWKKGSVERTLFYAPDLTGNPRRRLTMLRHFYGYLKTYATYYFEREKAE